jgi:glycogen(starch) synthase
VNILVLTDRYPPFYEGAYELNCQHVTDALRTRGHRLTVLTTTYGVESPMVDGHVHRLLHSVYRPYRGRWQRRIAQVRELIYGQHNYRIARRLARQIAPDLVFVWNMQIASILPVLAVQDAGYPTVFRIGSHWPVHQKREYVDEPSAPKRWYRAALMGFRRFEELRLVHAIMVSETLKESHRRAGFDVKRMVVIPTGIPAQWIAAQPPHRPSRDGQVRLLYAGRLEVEKGTDVAVQAIEHLTYMCGHHHVCLDLAGRGQPAYVERLREMVAAAHLEKHVRLLGFLPREELLARYPEYDALLFTSLRWEGFPTTIVEAMAKGLVVIASDIGGPQDIVVDGQNGFLVPPNEPGALADAIERVIRAPAVAAEMGRTAIQTVRQQHTFERMLNEYEAYLESVCS